MPVEHLVIVMMENHSFDEYFGTFPGVAGFSDPSPAFSQPWAGKVLMPWRASTFTSTGTGPAILGHDWQTFHQAVNPTVTQASGVYSATGDNLGFYASQGAPQNEGLMSYYAANDIPYHWALASNFGLCDHYFQSVLAGTYPNRMYLLGGSILANSNPTTGLVSYTGVANPPIIYNDLSTNGIPNLAISLAAPKLPVPIENGPLSYLQTLIEAGVSYRVYDDWNWTFDWGQTPDPTVQETDLNVAGYYPPYNNPPNYKNQILGLLGDPNYRAANYSDGAQRTAAATAAGDLRPLFAQDVAPLDRAADGPGTLATVTWIYPPWVYCEHPSAPTNTQAADGAYYLSQIVNSVINSHFWESTVLVIVYDKSNNHFDHVVPGMASSNQETWVTDTTAYNQPAPIGAGPRVPAIIVSPWTYQKGVIKNPMDHTSLLRMVEDLAGPGNECPSFPANSWRRGFFDDLSAVIAGLAGSAATTADINQDRSSPGGLPNYETVGTWRTNAQNRYAYASQHQNENDPSAQPLQPPTPPQPWPPPTQTCEITLLQTSYGMGDVTSQANGASTATFSSKIQVTLAGFEPAELTTNFAAGPFGTVSSSADAPYTRPRDQFLSG